MKIFELEENKSYTVALLVKAVTPRETKQKKPYLSIEFYDGMTSIMGNYWDWGGTKIPETNAILNVEAQVTSWQGTKQLNVKSLSTNTELHLADFLPSAGLDVREVYKEAYCLMSDIDDSFLRQLCLAILEETQERWLVAPAAIAVHHAYVAGTMIHCLSTAKLARVMAIATAGANVAMATAGGFLHDVGKLFGYDINGIVCEMTDEGMLYEHSFIGAEFVGNFAEEHGMADEMYNEAKLQMLRHIILSHHGSLEHGATITPVSMEAHIVHHADAVDSAAESIRAASAKISNSKFSEKIWALNNRPHLTTDYVQAVMGGSAK